jgi:hypothetical protein
MPKDQQAARSAELSVAARAAGINASAADFEPPTPPAGSADIQEYNLHVKQAEAAGRTPMGIDEFLDRQANRRRQVVHNLPSGMDPKVFAATQSLSKAISADPVYRDMLDVQTGYQGVKQGLSLKDGLSDIAAINAFQRMVDPGATVREGDVKLIQTARGFLQKMNPEYWLKRLESGDQLPQGTRDAMLRMAEQLYSTRARNYEQMVGRKFKKQAADAGIPWESVGTDFEIPSGKSNDTAAPSGGFNVGDSFGGGKIVSVEDN